MRQHSVDHVHIIGWGLHLYEVDRGVAWEADIQSEKTREGEQVSLNFKYSYMKIYLLWGFQLEWKKSI